MRIDVVWTPAELEHLVVDDRVAVVIDVLRAATSIVTALHNGARAVLPAESIEAALRIANSLGRDDVVLCGERGGLRIEGFDLGNSPAEFSEEAVSERTLVMTTTNGTQALAAAAGARIVYIAALVNLSAVADRLHDDGGDPLVVCAGRAGRVSADDALCAGLLVRALLERALGSASLSLGDGAIAARALAERHASAAAEFLRGTAAGRALHQIGHAADIEYCAALDALADVPVFRDRQITRVGQALTSAVEGGTQEGELSDGRPGG